MWGHWRLAGLILLLAACASPQERCIARATRDEAVLNRLIAETRANLSRGYAYETREVTRWAWDRCETPIGGPTGAVPGRCWLPYTATVSTEIAIDPEEEGRRLANLIERRDAAMRAAAPRIAECRAAYPEA